MFSKIRHFSSNSNRNPAAHVQATISVTWATISVTWATISVTWAIGVADEIREQRE